jgi:hypothetical protein
MENCHVTYDTQLASKEMNVESRGILSRNAERILTTLFTEERRISLYSHWLQTSVVSASHQNVVCCWWGSWLFWVGWVFIFLVHIWLTSPPWPVLWKWRVLVRYLQIVLSTDIHTLSFQSMHSYAVLKMEFNIMPYEKFSI